MTRSVQQVEFLGSYPEAKLIPDSSLPEFSFWGRSNVGKSSLINYLCGRKELARISSTPGKTREFNLYQIDQAFQLMDLPGYGYAKVAKSKKATWDKEIKEYLKTRKNLCLLFLLIDISIEPQNMDIQKINELGQNEIPFYILYTKSDKCKASQRSIHRQMMENILSDYWDELPVFIETSSNKFQGRENILNAINSIIRS